MTGSNERASLDALVDAGYRLPPVLSGSRRLTERVPVLRPLAVLWHRTRRRLRWWTARVSWARERQAGPLPVLVKAHGSVLLRQLGASEMWLQRNKVRNLEIVAKRLDGLLIGPGETFSFCRTVGKQSRRKGYVEAMVLTAGKVRPGVGGGICQAANLVHWMVLHSPLTVVERSEHGVDPFPDNGRVVPWGTGCTIAYNYVDLQVRNDTDLTFQLRIAVGEHNLEGELRADREHCHTYEVCAKDEHFHEIDGRYLRRNEIWRTVYNAGTGEPVREELLKRNLALTMYVPADLNS